MEKWVGNIETQVLDATMNQRSWIIPLSVAFLRASVLPCLKFLFSCANLGHWPNACDIRALVSSNFCWREKSEISRFWFWTQLGISGPNRNHLFLLSPRLSEAVKKPLHSFPENLAEDIFATPGDSRTTLA